MCPICEVRCSNEEIKRRVLCLFGFWLRRFQASEIAFDLAKEILR
jgi:hypothetical protein